MGYYELGETYEDYQTALEAVKIAVYKYNHKRPHRSVDLMFPVDAHKMKGPLKKHWNKKRYKMKEQAGITENVVLSDQD